MVFETQRLFGRLWTDQDFEKAQKLWGDPKVMNLISQNPLSSMQVKEKLIEQIEMQKKYDVQYWATVSKVNNEIVGCCGIQPQDIEKKIYEMGYHFMSDQWGKGFATEAATGVIKYSKSLGNISKLVAGHHPENQASRQILLKLGFQYCEDKFFGPTGLMHPYYELNVAT